MKSHAVQESRGLPKVTDRQKEQNLFDHPFLGSINLTDLSQVCKEQAISNESRVINSFSSRHHSSSNSNRCSSNSPTIYCVLDAVT